MKTHENNETALAATMPSIKSSNTGINSRYAEQLRICDDEISLIAEPKQKSPQFASKL